MRNRFILHSSFKPQNDPVVARDLSNEQPFFFFPRFCLLFAFAVVSLHDPFRGELGKNAVAKSVSDGVRLLAGPRSPCAPVLSAGHCTQKPVRRPAPTICTGRTGPRPSCVSSFCHGNTDYWICLDAACLSSRNHGLLELYLESLCWKNGRALLPRAVICWCCWVCWWFGCSAFSQLPVLAPKTHLVTLPGSQWMDGRAAVLGFCMASRLNLRR